MSDEIDVDLWCPSESVMSRVTILQKINSCIDCVYSYNEGRLMIIDAFFFSFSENKCFHYTVLSCTGALAIYPLAELRM